MTETQKSGTISPQLARIEQLAREHPDWAFRTLNHLLTREWMREAWRRTRKNGAVGVDGESAEQFEQDLEGNLQRLVDALHDPTYRAPLVRRVHIPKGDGRMRPIGVPTFADKVMQRAVSMVLEALYEPLFDKDSYGSRRGRSAHMALSKLRTSVTEMRGAWILEIDIRSYFDTIDHGHLRSFLDERVTDGVIRRMIHKWLHAGILFEGTVTYPEEGTPQGGVLSPLLGNVYLHHVMDRWFRTEVQPRMRGRSEMVRYADDIALAFEREEDARRVLKVIHQRFAKYGLTLHPDKTRLLYFGPPAGANGGTPPTAPNGESGSTAGKHTFELLGFVHMWTRGMYPGWRVVLKTASKRLTRFLQGVRAWCAKHLHEPVGVIVEGLCKRLRGHAAYFDVFGNRRAIDRVVYETRGILRAALSRRSQKGLVTWDAFRAQMRRTPLWSPYSATARVGSVIGPAARKSRMR